MKAIRPFQGYFATKTYPKDQYRGAMWTQRMVSGPSARWGHAMAYDAARGVIVLFGGEAGSHALSGETWEREL